jgi:hypothetical protein
MVLILSPPVIAVAWQWLNVWVDWQWLHMLAAVLFPFLLLCWLPITLTVAALFLRRKRE